jgi:hypothetical protein
MSFPDHIAAILDSHGVRADTKSALYELYVSMGDEVLDVFGDVAERAASVTDLMPEDTLAIRHAVVERYLRRNHPRWQEGQPTPSFWHPRELEGRASGLILPLDFRVDDITRSIVGNAQPVPEGVLLFGKNAHYGGRIDTISFEVVAADLEDAIRMGRSEGQQHTTPGSAGETSGTHDAIQSVALLWEIQPNVFKPGGDRNRAIAKIYRKHRNWHVATLAAALSWLRGQKCAIFILRGEALATTHEVNPDKPVSETIVAHHNHTVEQVSAAMGLRLCDATTDDGFQLLDSTVMNHALRKHVLQHGAPGAIWRVDSA